MYAKGKPSPQFPVVRDLPLRRRRPVAAAQIERSRASGIKARSILRSLERFHNSCALAGIEQGGFFLMKKPLSSSGSGVRQLWNRYSLRTEVRIHLTEPRPSLKVFCARPSFLLLSTYTWSPLLNAARVVACRTSSTGVPASLRSPSITESENTPEAEQPGLFPHRSGLQPPDRKQRGLHDGSRKRDTIIAAREPKRSAAVEPSSAA